jgi:hypothetical protein
MINKMLKLVGKSLLSSLVFRHGCGMEFVTNSSPRALLKQNLPFFLHDVRVEGSYLNLLGVGIECRAGCSLAIFSCIRR